MRSHSASGFGPSRRKRIMEREEDNDDDAYDELIDRDILRINS